MADEPPPLRSDPPTKDDIRELIAWGKRTATAMAATRSTANTAAGSGPSVMASPHVPEAPRTASQISPAASGATRAMPDSTAAAPDVAPAISNSTPSLPGGSPTEPSMPAEPSVPAFPTTRETSSSAEDTTMVAQDSTPAALESSPAAPDASTPESRAPPTGTDDTSYFSEVGLGPLARQLCLVGPSNDTARHGASGSRDRLMEVDDDGFIDANKPTFVLTTTIGDVTGSKTGIPRANTGAVQQPYLWEHTTNDKISHFMNGMRHENVPRILFSAQTTGSTDNHWVELGFYKERTRIKMGDVVLESNFTNYKLIIEAFHLMRFRKTELVKEWQRQTPEKAQLLQVLPHELNDSDIKQARYAVRPWDKLATLEVSSTGGLLGGPLVYRRLVLRRALPDPNNLLEEPRALYISVNTGQVVNQKPGDVIIPETERDYACLAAFFGKEKARVWQGHAYSDARATATRPSLGISHRNRPENAKPAAVSFSDENIPPKTANRGEHDGEYGNVSFQPTSQGPLTKSQKRVRLRQRMKERARQASQDQGGSQ